MPTAEPSARGLRDRPLGKAAILVAILLLAVLVSRACAGAQPRIGQDEAVEIAKREVEHEADRVDVRFVRRGVPSRGYWAVSVTSVDEAGAADERTLVVVDAGTGDVAEVRRQTP